MIPLKFAQWMGGKYKVVPSDITICCTWTPTMELEINNVKKTVLQQVMVRLYELCNGRVPWIKMR